MGICGVFTYAAALYVKKFGILAAVPMEVIFFLGLKQKISWESYWQDSFINFDMLDYFVIGGVPGRNYIFPIAFCAILIILSAVLIHMKINNEQFD